MTINHAPHASQAIVNLAISAGITAEVIANSRGSHRRHHANGSTAVPQKVVPLNGIRMSLGQARQYVEARQQDRKENEDIETLGCDDPECECRRALSWPDNLPCMGR